MNRRLRLALLLAALAAAGPSVSAPQAFDPGRAQVAIAWLRANPASRPQRQQAGQALRLAAVARAERLPRRDTLLPNTFRLHSLFQRPPPLHS